MVAVRLEPVSEVVAGGDERHLDRSVHDQRYEQGRSQRQQPNLPDGGVTIKDIREREQDNKVIEVKAVGALAQTAKSGGEHDGGLRRRQRQQDKDSGAQRRNHVVDRLYVPARRLCKPKDLRIEEDTNRQQAQLNRSTQ